MPRYVKNGRATKGVVRKTGRLAETYRKKTPQEQAKLKSVISGIREYGPSVASMAIPGPTTIGRGIKSAAKAGIAIGKKVTGTVSKRVTKKVVAKAFRKYK